MPTPIDFLTLAARLQQLSRQFLVESKQRLTMSHLRPAPAGLS